MASILIQFIIKIKQMYQHKLNTFDRQAINGSNLNGSLSGSPYKIYSNSTRQDTSFNYKSKNLQLMQSLTDAEIKLKEAHRTIFYLHRELQIIQKDLTSFLKGFGLASLPLVKQKYALMQEKLQKLIQDVSQKPLLKEQKITNQYEKILKQYKNIISCQEEKMIKYQSKWKKKQSQMFEQVQKGKKQQKQLLQKLQQLSLKLQNQKQLLINTHKNQIQKILSEIKQNQSKITQEEFNLIKQNQQMLLFQKTQLKQDLDLIKNEFQQLLIQNKSLEDKHQKLKKKYKQQIEHFEAVERQVQEKLIEVEKEITFYKEQRHGHLDQIKQLKFENTFIKQNLTKNQLEEEFSFGGYLNAQTQTENWDAAHQDKELIINAECYQISIKSLLQQNARLKRTLVLLDKVKKGEEIPAEVQLQLKLLKGLSEIQCKTQSDRDNIKESLDSPNFNNILKSQDLYNEFESECPE